MHRLSRQHEVRLLILGNFQLRMKVSILASVQEEANALRSKTAMLQSKCRECEQVWLWALQLH